MSYDVGVGKEWFNYTSNLRRFFHAYGVEPESFRDQRGGWRVTVQHQRRRARQPGAWFRFSVPTLTAVIAAAGWANLDIETERWWLLALAIVIGAGVWITVYASGRYWQLRGWRAGYAEGTVDEIEREIQKRANR